MNLKSTNLKIINILFLGGAKRVSVAQHMIEEGTKRGLKVHIFSYELDTEVPIACLGSVIKGLRWNDENLFTDLKRVILEHKINLLLPFVDPAIRVASELKNMFPKVFIPISNVEICDVMFDKLLSAKWFAAHHISQPNYYEHLEDFNYPVIMKPRYGSASRGIVVCHTASDIPSDIQIDNYLIQDYIADNTEISVDCYVNEQGVATSVVPRVRLETAGGEAVRSITIRNAMVIEQAKQIIGSGEFRGPITIQFIKDNNNGNVYVMEINPRLGGGVVTSIGAQSGIISMIFDEYEGKLVVPKEDWIENALMVRYFKEVVFHADCN